jgi:hypothetical protein
MLKIVIEDDEVVYKIEGKGKMGQSESDFLQS